MAIQALLLINFSVFYLQAALSSNLVRSRRPSQQ